MKDTKHIRRDFHSVPWVMPQGWGAGGAQGVGKNFKHGHLVSQIDGDDEQNRMQVYPRVKLVILGRGQRSNIIKFQLPCQFQRFLYQILCVYSQIKDTIHIRRVYDGAPSTARSSLSILSTPTWQTCHQIRLIEANYSFNFIFMCILFTFYV